MAKNVSSDPNILMPLINVVGFFFTQIVMTSQLLCTCIDDTAPNIYLATFQQQAKQKRCQKRNEPNGQVVLRGNCQLVSEKDNPHMTLTLIFLFLSPLVFTNVKFIFKSWNTQQLKVSYKSPTYTL